MNLPTFYAEATGNTFLIVINCQSNIAIDSQSINSLIKFNQHLDFDGILIVSKHLRYEFEVEYFNNDGSFETLCINGCRCVSLIMYQHFGLPKKFQFVAGDGLHVAEVLSGQNIKITLSPPQFLTDKLSLFNLSGRSVDVGVKHFVINFNRPIVESTIKVLGKKIRNHQYFKPKGTNVNFYRAIDSYTIDVHTYEKGVEKYMLSCATGSVAACYDAFKRGLVGSPITAINPGGKLIVEFNSQWRDVWLKGPAKIISQIQK